VEVNGFPAAWCAELFRDEGTPGAEVTLTLDAGLQQFASSAASARAASPAS